VFRPAPPAGKPVIDDELRGVLRAVFRFPIEKPARNPYLPPVEFDHPYDGTLTITRTDIRGVTAMCDTVKLPPWSRGLLGCVRIKRDSCDVYIAHDDLLFAFRTSYDVIWRHERGHCNGWRHAQEYK